MRTFREITTDRDALKARRETITRDLELLDRAAGGEPLKGGQSERWENLTRGVERIDVDLAKLDDEYRDGLRDIAENHPENLEPGDGGAPLHGEQRTVRDRDDSVPPHVRTSRDAGLRTIERHKGALSAAAADNLDGLIRNRDPQGVDARYIDAVGNPAYLAAFGKMVADPQFGHLRFTPQEVAAVQAVTAVQAERAHMAEGTTTTGGFAIPFTLDPTVLLSSSGVLNPIRSVARSFTISTSTWKGLSSDGITASYVAEAAASTDNSPTLAQPVITTAQGRAFVPISIELTQDWAGWQNELVRLVSDGRDVLDATQFLSGNGSSAPIGLLAIGTTGALTQAGQRVLTATTATTVLADIYTFKQALPARFIPNATFAAHPTVWDIIYRLTPSGSTTEPQIMTSREAPLLGKPRIEWSTMQTGTTTTGQRIAIYGDFSNFYIADRLGMTVELIPHIFGAAQGNLPTGERGLFAYWRTGSVVAVITAFKYLEVK